MKRLIAVVLLAAACASTGPVTSFQSDRINVATRGSGPDLILIPGLTGNRDDWGAIVDDLDDRYRLHLVQLNGFGGVPSAANAQGPVSAAVTDEIARYISEQRLIRPAVAGHSMGGTIGMMLAARYPDLVGRLMVIDMMPFMGPMLGPAAATPEGLRAAADQVRAQILSDPNAGMLGQMFPTMTRVEEKRALLMRRLRESDRSTVANAFHELVVTDLRPELSRITVPFSVVYVVPANPPIPADQYDAAFRQLYTGGNPVFVRIDDSNHFIQWDQPARLAAEIDRLMRR